MHLEKIMGYSSVFEIWKDAVKKFPQRVALSDGTSEITFLTAYREICYLAECYKKFGLEKGDKVCIFAENSPHWLLIEQGAICIGAISVAKNSKIGIKELDYVFKNSDSTSLITDNPEIINYFVKNNPDFVSQQKMVIFLGHDECFRNNEKITYFSDIMLNFNKNNDYFSDYDNKPDDVCYIYYTSGTSSMPKGAILVNYGMAYQVEEIQRILPNESPELFLETFPLASAGGKTFNLYALSVGCKIVYTPYVGFFEKLAQMRPSLIHFAPKIVMTLLGKYYDYINSRGKLFRHWFDLNYTFSMQIMKIQRKFYAKRKTNTVAKGFDGFCENFLSLIRKFQDKILYKKIRNYYINDNTVLAIGSASLANKAEDFFSIIGVRFMQHYGMTETTGLTTHATIQDQQERPYTVGLPFSKTKFKIVDPETMQPLPPMEKGVLMLKGPEILKGYYNNPEATKKALTPDGWLITGDLAFAYPDDYLVILSRYDDVIVMMNGYNVYAPPIQDQINASHFVKQSVVVGQAKPYLAAVIVLDNDAYEKWCNENSSKVVNPNDNAKFKEVLLQDINELISKKTYYKYYEKIKYVYLLQDEFSVENGTLTNTLKVKYRKVCELYKNEIDALYKTK